MKHSIKKAGKSPPPRPDEWLHLIIEVRGKGAKRQTRIVEIASAPDEKKLLAQYKPTRGWNLHVQRILVNGQSVHSRDRFANSVLDTVSPLLLAMFEHGQAYAKDR